MILDLICLMMAHSWSKTPESQTKVSISAWPEIPLGKPRHRVPCSDTPVVQVKLLFLVLSVICTGKWHNITALEYIMLQSEAISIGCCFSNFVLEKLEFFLLKFILISCLSYFLVQHIVVPRLFYSPFDSPSGHPASLCRVNQCYLGRNITLFRNSFNHSFIMNSSNTYLLNAHWAGCWRLHGYQPRSLLNLPGAWLCHNFSDLHKPHVMTATNFH